MISETTRRKVHAICYLLAAVVLIVLYYTKQTPVGLIGGIACAVMAVWHYFAWQTLKRREEEADEE